VNNGASDGADSGISKTIDVRQNNVPNLSYLKCWRLCDLVLTSGDCLWNTRRAKHLLRITNVSCWLTCVGLYNVMACL